MQPLLIRHTLRKTALAALAIAGFLSCGAFSTAQELSVSDKPYRIIVQASGGLALSAARESILPVPAEVHRMGLSGSLRLIWRPDHMLGIGLETGLGHIVSATSSVTDIEMETLSAPALLVFVMEKYSADLSISFGWHRYIVYRSGVHLSSSWEMAYGVGVGYTFEFGESIGIGAELKAQVLQERNLLLLQPQLRFQWTISY